MRLFSLALMLLAFCFGTAAKSSAHSSSLNATLNATSTEPQAGQVQYVKAQPLSQVVNTRKGDIKPGADRKVPVITWGGDVPTIAAAMEGYFKAEGLDITVDSLFCENDFVKQLQMFINGEIVYLRGTSGMLNLALDALNAAGIETVATDQLSWSTNGDCLVARENIKNPKDLRGADILLQYPGPHVSFAANVLKTAKVPLREVNFFYMKELTLPTYDTKGAILDPRSAFAADSSKEAAFVISPDRNALCMGKDGKVGYGSGSDGSVKGAHDLINTGAADRIIPDLYLVRKDYYDANRGKVEGFVRAQLRGQELISDMLKSPGTQQAKYTQILGKGSELLLGGTEFSADVDGMLHDCLLAGFSGNVAFFTGRDVAGNPTTRTLQILADEEQSSFVEMGLMRGTVPMRGPGSEWDWNKIAKGLKYANVVTTTAVRSDAAKAGAKVESLANSEEDIPYLFSLEVAFETSQTSFPAAQYAEQFDTALLTWQTYSGALFVIEGHVDPYKVNKLRAEFQSATDEATREKKRAELALVEQACKNDSLKRAEAVRDAFVEYCQAKGFNIDKGQVLIAGRGASSPIVKDPKSKVDQAKNRRVEFVMSSISAEEELPEGK